MSSSGLRAEPRHLRNGSGHSPRAAGSTSRRGLKPALIRLRSYFLQSTTTPEFGEAEQVQPWGTSTHAHDAHVVQAPESLVPHETVQDVCDPAILQSSAPGGHEMPTHTGDVPIGTHPSKPAPPSTPASVPLSLAPSAPQSTLTLVSAATLASWVGDPSVPQASGTRATARRSAKRLGVDLILTRA